MGHASWQKKDLSCSIANLRPYPGKCELSAVTWRENGRLAPGDLCALVAELVGKRTLRDKQQSHLGARLLLFLPNTKVMGGGVVPVYILCKLIYRTY